MLMGLTSDRSPAGGVVNLNAVMVNARRVNACRVDGQGWRAGARGNGWASKWNRVKSNRPEFEMRARQIARKNARSSNRAEKCAAVKSGSPAGRNDLASNHSRRRGHGETAARQVTGTKSRRRSLRRARSASAQFQRLDQGGWRGADGALARSHPSGVDARAQAAGRLHRGQRAALDFMTRAGGRPPRPPAEMDRPCHVFRNARASRRGGGLRRVPGFMTRRGHVTPDL